MANATKSTKSPGKVPPTPKAKAPGQAPPPTETRLLADGSIERYKNGQLVSTTPPPQPNGQAKASPPKPPAAKGRAKAPTQPAAKPVPRLSTPASADTPEHFVAKRGTEDIYGFTPRDPTDPSKGVRMRHYRGYDLLREARFSEPHATKFVHELIHDKGFEYVDGEHLRLVDEDR
jgi:hypothetical protein